MSDSHSSPQSQQPVSTVAGLQIPVAVVESTVSERKDRRGGISRLWWLTLGCVILAGWLAWTSLPSKGITIVIQFPEGHGLKAGDPIRHRGIDVGQVTDVRLTQDMTSIIATATLLPGSEQLANAGTRFWIVRPQLSLAGVSGLDTAVGSKYIAVSPGDPGQAADRTFEGLAVPPVDEFDSDGIDLVLQGDARHGISAGAPVTWRGVDVGRVLSVAISPDARHVNIQIRIEARYRRLVKNSSVFWVTSGFGVDVGIGGLRVNADSLSTILRGGVAFATPKAQTSTVPVSANQVFVLHVKPEPEWTSGDSAVPLVDFELPRTAGLDIQKKTSILGISRTRHHTQEAVILTSKSNRNYVLTALHELSTDADSSPTVTLQLRTAATSAIFDFSKDNVKSFGDGGWIAIPQTDNQTLGYTETRFRVASEPEELCVTRTVGTIDQPTDLVQTIDAAQMTKTEFGWLIQNEDIDVDGWIGSPAVSTTDGRIVGVLVLRPEGPTIVPIPEIPQ